MTTLLIKRSSTASAIPSAGSLSYGELALNIADGKLFFKKSDNSIAQFNPISIDTLDSVTDLGAITTNGITVGSIISNGDSTIGSSGSDEHTFNGHFDFINTTTQSLLNGSNWSSPSSLSFTIDSDNNSSNASFTVKKDAGTTVFNVNEAGNVSTYGNLTSTSDNTHTLGSSSFCFANMFADKASFKIRATDPAVVVDHAIIYSKDVSSSAEMFVKDEAGNVTQISPHNEDGDWIYWSENKKTGKKVKINMEKMIKKLEEITGESFFEEYDSGQLKL